jgi:hypothetical protein
VTLKPLLRLSVCYEDSAGVLGAGSSAAVEGPEKKKTLKQDTPHLFRHQVSQVSAPEFQFERVMILPYQGVSRFEFQLYCRRIPFVSQGVVCSHSPRLQVSWTFPVIVFEDPRGSTLFVSMYISLSFSIRRFA